MDNRLMVTGNNGGEEREVDVAINGQQGSTR